MKTIGGTTINKWPGTNNRGQAELTPIVYLQANGSIKLDNSTGNVQLDRGWIDGATNRLIATGDPVKQQTADLILRAQDRGNLIKIVAGVNENGVTLVKLAR